MGDEMVLRNGEKFSRPLRKRIILAFYAILEPSHHRSMRLFGERAPMATSVHIEVAFIGCAMANDQRIHHFHRGSETPFTVDERAGVTILLGELTWTHERLIQAVLQRNGYQSECLQCDSPGPMSLVIRRMRAQEKACRASPQYCEAILV